MVTLPFKRKRDLRSLKDQPSVDIAADCISQIPWTYSGQGIDMEGTDKKM
jgi:hypothetical protein